MVLSIETFKLQDKTEKSIPLDDFVDPENRR